MDEIEAAILRTVIYADLFNFPLTPREIHHFLVHNQPISPDKVEARLGQSAALRPLLTSIDGYIVYCQRDELVALRKAREAASEGLWPLAVQHGAWLARLPFVRMVAITGALAMRNAAHANDDLDYIVVTAPHRVWIARAFAILLVRLGRLYGIEICPNYVLAENALEQDNHDIFMAHEIAQMIPLHGHEVYRRFRATNQWVLEQLPNTADPFYSEADYHPRRVWNALKRGLETILGGGLGDWIERWEYRRKLRRFAHDMQTPNSSAKLDEEHVKGHFNDHGHPILQKYYERLREYGIEGVTSVAMPGD
jgi:hypothetical protein